MEAQVQQGVGDSPFARAERIRVAILKRDLTASSAAVIAEMVEREIREAVDHAVYRTIATYQYVGDALEWEVWAMTPAAPSCCGAA